MKAEKYIKEKLKYLINKYPTIKLIYDINYYDGEETHLIKIYPENIEKNTEFLNDECNIVSEFLNTYPYHGIVFFSYSDFLKIERPLLELIGSNFSNDIINN